MAEQRTTAHEAALRALRQRDLSAHELERRLRERGFEEGEREEAIESLLRAELLHDGRFATNRARVLAGRGAGDALIRHELVRAGVAPELVDRALDELEPESERAQWIVARRGGGPKTARYLSGKGFSEEVVGAVVAAMRDNELG